MGFTLFEDIGIVIGGVGILILTWIALTFIYYRCIKPRCCPNRPPPNDTPPTLSLPPLTIIQHVPPPPNDPSYEYSYQPVPEFNSPNYTQQNVYYPQMPAQPPPSYYLPPPQYTVQA